MAAGLPMVRPACSEQLDYEAELMLIVGTGGRHISENDALDHVFGYTVFINLSSALSASGRRCSLGAKR